MAGKAFAFSLKMLDKTNKRVIIYLSFGGFEMNFGSIKKGDIVFVVCNNDIKKAIVDCVLQPTGRIIGIKTDDGCVHIPEYIFMTRDDAIHSLNKRFHDSLERQTWAHNNLIKDIKERFPNG
jgi:hypothetical protein